MEEYRFILIVLAASLPAIGIEFLLVRFLKRRLWVYLVPMIALAATIGLLIYAFALPSEGFRSLGYFVMALMSGGDISYLSDRGGYFPLGKAETRGQIKRRHKVRQHSEAKEGIRKCR